MDLTQSIYSGFRMTKFRYKTINKQRDNPEKTKSIPRRVKNKSEAQLRPINEEENKLIFHCK